MIKLFKRKKQKHECKRCLENYHKELDKTFDYYRSQRAEFAVANLRELQNKIDLLTKKYDQQNFKVVKEVNK